MISEPTRTASGELAMLVVATLAVAAIGGAIVPSAAAAGGSAVSVDGGSTVSADGGSAVSADGEPPEATIGVENATADAGDTVTVAIAVSGDSIAGYQANLTWDPDVLRFESVEGVDFDDPVTNGGAGWLFMTQSGTDGQSSPTVARVTFSVVGDAGDASALAFAPADTSVNDEESQLETAVRDGTVTVDGDATADDESTSDPTATTASDDRTATTGDDGAGDSGSTESGADDDAATTGAGTAGNADGSDAAASDPDDDGGVSPLTMLAGLFGVGVVLGAGYVLGQRSGGASDA